MRWFPLTQESGPIAQAYWWLPDRATFIVTNPRIVSVRADLG